MARRLMAVLVVAAGGAASGCATGEGATTAGAAASETIDARYRAEGVGWRPDAGVVFVFRVFEQEGRVALCGAYFQTGQAPYGSTDILPVTVRRTGIRLDGETLAEGLSFFRQLPPDAQPLGKRADCRVTDVAWRPAFADAAPDLYLDSRPVRFRA
jgi:hypothetical protein